MVSAILTGVFDLAPTKLYKVGTMQDIPKPTDKAARQLQDFLLSPKLISVVSQETARCHHNHKYKKTDLQ